MSREHRWTNTILGKCRRWSLDLMISLWARSCAPKRNGPMTDPRKLCSRFPLSRMLGGCWPPVLLQSVDLHRADSLRRRKRTRKAKAGEEKRKQGRGSYMAVATFRPERGPLNLLSGRASKEDPKEMQRGQKSLARMAALGDPMAPHTRLASPLLSSDEHGCQFPSSSQP